MSRIELLQGTLDLLVLRVLNAGPMHGFGIAQKIHLLSADALRVEEGSLYPALYRMERKAWIEADEVEALLAEQRELAGERLRRSGPGAGRPSVATVPADNESESGLE